MLHMESIIRRRRERYMRKLSFLSFCRLIETDKNDNTDKNDT